MEGKPFRVCPHLRQRRSSIPDACVAPHGVHQRVGGERVVGGPRAHVLLKALNDYPIGPEDHKCPQTQMKTCKHEDAACRSAENHLLIMFYCLLLLKPRVSSCLWPVQNFYFSWSLSTQVLLRFSGWNVWYKSQYLPENIVMSVDLLPFLWILQYPTVPHHSTVDAVWFVAAILPVVQHLPVSRRVEDRKSLHQRC